MSAEHPGLPRHSRGEATQEFRPASAVRSPARVLVVDDNIDLADSLAMHLECLGYETHRAYTGLDGIRLTKALQPHVVILDIRMPGGINGLEACRFMRSRRWGKSLLIIAHSCLGDREIGELANAAGFDAYLEKAQNPDLLVERIGGLLERSRDS